MCDTASEFVVVRPPPESYIQLVFYTLKENCKYPAKSQFAYKDPSKIDN